MAFSHEPDASRSVSAYAALAALSHKRPLTMCATFWSNAEETEKLVRISETDDPPTAFRQLTICRSAGSVNLFIARALSSVLDRAFVKGVSHFRVRRPDVEALCA